MPLKRLPAAGLVLLLLACAVVRAQEGAPAEEMHGREALRGVEAVRVSRAPGAEVTAATWQHVGRVQFNPPEPARLVEGLVSFVDVFVKEHKAAQGR